MDGEKLSHHDDYNGGELEERGWTGIAFRPSIYDPEIYKWLEDNTDIDNEVRWVDTIAIFFRLETDAVAFKLRWV